MPFGNFPDALTVVEERFRIVYGVDRRHRVLRIMAVGHRRAVYEELAHLARPRRTGAR